VWRLLPPVLGRIDCGYYQPIVDLRDDANDGFQQSNEPTMPLGATQKLLIRWGAAGYACFVAVLCVLTVPLLACVIAFNLISPYNDGDAPRWVYVLLYIWFCGMLAPLILILPASFVRCPNCGLSMLRMKPPQVKTPVPIQSALLHAFRKKSTYCYRCGCEHSLT
jgi:hypothetical protein